MFHTFLVYVAAHPAETIGAVYAAASFLVALLPIAAREKPYVGVIVRFLERLSFLTHKDAPGTLKLPLLAADVANAALAAAAGESPPVPDTDSRIAVVPPSKADEAPR